MFSCGPDGQYTAEQLEEAEKALHAESEERKRQEAIANKAKREQEEKARVEDAKRRQYVADLHHFAMRLFRREESYLQDETIACDGHSRSERKSAQSIKPLTDAELARAKRVFDAKLAGDARAKAEAEELARRKALEQARREEEERVRKVQASIQETYDHAYAERVQEDLDHRREATEEQSGWGSAESDRFRARKEKKRAERVERERRVAEELARQEALARQAEEQARQEKEEQARREEEERRLKDEERQVMLAERARQEEERARQMALVQARREEEARIEQARLELVRVRQEQERARLEEVERAARVEQARREAEEQERRDAIRARAVVLFGRGDGWYDPTIADLEAAERDLAEEPVRHEKARREAEEQAKARLMQEVRDKIAKAQREAEEIAARRQQMITDRVVGAAVDAYNRNFPAPPAKKAGKKAGKSSK
jgi:hypothetical protein